MRFQSLLAFFAALQCILVLSLPGVAVADGNSDEQPGISGPVPAFKQRSKATRLKENVYVNIRYPVFGIAFLDKAVREQADGFIKGNDIASFPPKDEDGELTPCELVLGYDLYASKPGILSIAFSDWVYTGGTHGHPGYQAFTYNLRSKKRLRLKDVFPHWDPAREKLVPLLKDFIESEDTNCPSLEPADRMISPDATNCYLDSNGLPLAYSMGYAPPPEWLCSSISLDRETLEELGADMRYWEERQETARP